jgi:chemotaxis protein MotB
LLPSASDRRQSLEKRRRTKGRDGMTAAHPHSTWAPISIATIFAIAIVAGCAEEDLARQAALRDLAQQKQLTAERDRQIETRDKELADLKRRLADAESANQNAQKALDNASRSMDDLARAQAQAEARAAQFRKLVSQFRKMTESGKLKVEIRDNRMIVSVGDKILFDPGKTQLKTQGAETLKEVTEVLKDVAGRDFQVAGHTDNTPIRSARFRSNWDLSTARAVEVVNFMVASGMQPTRLSAAGYGDQAPVGSNETPEGRSQNRRIEITLMPNLDDLPPIAAEDAKAPPREGQPPATATAPKPAELPGPAGAPAPTPALLPPMTTPTSGQ